MKRRFILPPDSLSLSIFCFSDWWRVVLFLLEQGSSIRYRDLFCNSEIEWDRSSWWFLDNLLQIWNFVTFSTSSVYMQLFSHNFLSVFTLLLCSSESVEIFFLHIESPNLIWIQEAPEKSGWRSCWQSQISELKRRSMNKDSSQNMSWGARMRRQMNEQVWCNFRLSKPPCLTSVYSYWSNISL